MELALYNAALAGLSFDGTQYFRENPLEADGDHRRWDWHPCPEAATDIARTVVSIGGFFYSASEDGLAVHMYGGGSTIANVGGRAISLTESSDYPWDGDITFTLDLESASEFTLWLRVPAWAEGASARINGAGIDIAANMQRGYLALRRQWQSGDTIALSLPMRVARLKAHPAVAAAAGRTALQRGPLVYCFEAADNPDGCLDSLVLPPGTRLGSVHRDDLFGGIVAITAEGLVGQTDWGRGLYSPRTGDGKPATVTAIPYYLWGNREPGKMLVWVPET
jgi:DUF1680 family protein